MSKTIGVDADGHAAEIHEIVPSVSIENLLAHRDATIALLRNAYETITQAEAMANAAHIGFPNISASRRFRGSDLYVTGEFADREAVFALFQSIVDAGAWRYLMNESGMRTFMSAAKRDELDKQLMGDTIPTLTREAIRDTFGALHDARADMFEQGVIECFRNLSWKHYKTNLPQKFGKRIIVTYLTSYSHANHRKVSELDDLMRVFHVFDGKPEADHRQGCSVLINDATRAQHGWPKSAENEYFSLRLFRNNNGHVTFKRPDLVDRLNQIIAKHYPNALPASQSSKHAAAAAERAP